MRTDDHAIFAGKKPRQFIIGRTMIHVNHRFRNGTSAQLGDEKRVVFGEGHHFSAKPLEHSRFGHVDRIDRHVELVSHFRLAAAVNPRTLEDPPGHFLKVGPRSLNRHFEDPRRGNLPPKECRIVGLRFG